jgi:multidrug efflux pump subunit AcrA (membrane-fusion protein)
MLVADTLASVPGTEVPLSTASLDCSSRPVRAEPFEDGRMAQVPLSEIQLWYHTSDGQLKPVAVCNELQLLAEGRVRELALSCIQAQVIQACSVLSPEFTWLVALPVKDPHRGCLIAIYHGGFSDNPVSSIVQAVMPVLSAANRIAAEQLTPLPGKVADKPAESVASSRSSLASLSWRDLAAGIYCKLQGSLGNRSRLGIAAAVLLSLLLAGLIPIPYRVYCDVTCEPATRRYVSAPFDSTLIKSFVSVGEHVQAGDLLATLDGRELRSQLAALQAEYAKELQLKLAALRTREHAEAELARLRSERLAFEIQVVEQKLVSLEIRSPIDGIVVSGNLERVEGAAVKVGETLFEIGHLGEMIVELQVPEEKVDAVAIGSSVVVTLDSFGGQPFRTSVKTIHPRSELIGNVSVFVAEATLPSATLELRPGMHGSATVAAGYRALGWVLLHRPYYRVRQFLGW